MKRETLEKYQVLVYLTAIGCGLAIGVLLTDRPGVLEDTLCPLLVLLLYTTFCQAPLAHMSHAISDTRFLKAAVTGNFLVIPAILWGVIHLAPTGPGDPTGCAARSAGAVHGLVHHIHSSGSRRYKACYCLFASQLVASHSGSGSCIQHGHAEFICCVADRTDAPSIL